MTHSTGRIHPRRKQMTAALLAVMVGAFTVLTALASPAPADTAPSCGAGRPVVDVTYRFFNEQDITSDGTVWALVSGVSRYRLYRTGPTSFCALESVTGTFTAFGGPSPAGTGTIPAGHRGVFRADALLRYEGTFAPTLPLRGFVGTFDAGCDQFDCATPIRFGTKYLQLEGPPTAEWYRVTYTSACGVWVQTSEGDQGDIAC